MDSNIVRDFQKLHVLKRHSIKTMDELVQDLTSALNETTKSGSGGHAEMRSVSRRYNRKRRGKKRRTCSSNPSHAATGNVSEASESSFDEVVKGYYDKVMWQSDSDDFYKKPHIPMGCLSGIHPTTNMPTFSLPESDSVNENFSPARLHRRKRRQKRMNIDNTVSSSVCTANKEAYCGNIGVSSGRVITGKRKRNLVDRTPPVFDSSNMDTGDLGACGGTATAGNMQKSNDGAQDIRVHYKPNGAAQFTNESSSLSSTDGETNCDDRDGDDEHSDFFHESECSVAGVIPWWENEQIASQLERLGEDSQQSIIRQQNAAHLQTRLRYILGKREIRTARRKLKDRCLQRGSAAGGGSTIQQPQSQHRCSQQLPVSSPAGHTDASNSNSSNNHHHTSHLANTIPGPTPSVCGATEFAASSKSVTSSQYSKRRRTSPHPATPEALSSRENLTSDEQHSD